MVDEFVILVDQNDNPIGTEEKVKCHLPNGKLHRAFTALLFDIDGRLVLTKRAKGKMLWPGDWDGTFASHPRESEGYVSSGERRMPEELGINGKLDYFHKFEYHVPYKDVGSENEICGTLVGVIDKNTELKEIEGEIDEIKWISAKELIAEIIEEIGEGGTLMMPAYPKSKPISKFDDKVNFDVNHTPSGAGYLTEVFRKYAGVKRSINIQQSVCAYGKLADYFVSEHHYSVTNWDEFSPYYKMSMMNTLVFSFGLPYFLGTIIHCTESVLRTKYAYFQMFFKKEKKYKYIDADGNIGEQCYWTHDFARKRSKKKIIKKYFNKAQFHHTKISNLRIEMIDAKYTLDLYLQLADCGITMYSIPSPKRYLDDCGKFLKIE